MLTLQYRLYPNKIQQKKLWSHANKLNWLYNYFLNQRNQAYETNKTSIKKSQQQAELVQLKQNDPVLAEIHSQVLQQVPLRLDNAFQAFFRRLKQKVEDPGYPKFRSCHEFFGICYPQSGFSIQSDMFKTKIYGEIKFNKHREIKGNIKQINITCKKDKWFINITTDYSEKIPAPQGDVGIDIGLKTLVVGTDGTKIKNNNHAKYFDKQIAKIQSRMDKNMKKGSKRYKYLKQVKQRLYGAKVRKINDFQHKVSRDLVSRFDTIYVEDLSVKTMSEGDRTNLNKAIRNAKLAQFISFLSYKANRLIKVNPMNTSKVHNKCGHLFKDLKLSDRTIVCEECREIYDRDKNAAENVYCLGRAIVSGLCTQSDTIVEAIALRQL